MWWKSSPGEADALDLAAVTQLRDMRGRRAFNAVLWVTDVTAEPQYLWTTQPSPVSLDDKLSQLATTLIPQGIAQLNENKHWAWLLQLSGDLKQFTGGLHNFGPAYLWGFYCAYHL